LPQECCRQHLALEPLQHQQHLLLYLPSLLLQQVCAVQLRTCVHACLRAPQSLHLGWPAGQQVHLHHPRLQQE
jgi:hypothetical protein